MDLDYPSGQEYDEEKNTLLMDNGDNQIIDIYKKIPDVDLRRKNSSSKSRHNSRSNSSPGRFISSESKRK